MRLLCDMAVKNSSVGALLKPSLVSDGSGCFMYVSCGNNPAQLYLDKLMSLLTAFRKVHFVQGLLI